MRPENLHHSLTWCNNFQINMMIAQTISGRSDVTVTLSVTCIPIWTDYTGDTMWLTQLLLQQQWLFLPTWVRNVNLHHVVQSTWRICEWQSVSKFGVTVDMCHVILMVVYVQFVILLLEFKKNAKSVTKLSAWRTSYSRVWLENLWKKCRRHESRIRIKVTCL
jgi:hypothetical protein